MAMISGHLRGGPLHGRRLTLATDTRNNPPAELRLVDRSGVAHKYRLGGSTVRASVWAYDWAGAVDG